MRKYICNACGIRICTAEYQSGSGIPMKCTALIDKYCKAAWQEVKEEERPAQALPDWVQECAIGYDNEQDRYFEVTNIDEKFVDIEYLDDGIGATCDYPDMQKCSEARKRPYNAGEMKALVGKVIEDNVGNCSLINNYISVNNQVTVFCAYCNADKLMEIGYTVDGKPCYVLEHKNDKGEWVE